MKVTKICLVGCICIQLLTGINLQAQSTDLYGTSDASPTDSTFEELIVKLSTPTPRRIYSTKWVLCISQQRLLFLEG